MGTMLFVIILRHLGFIGAFWSLFLQVFLEFLPQAVQFGPGSTSLIIVAALPLSEEGTPPPKNLLAARIEPKPLRS